MKKHNSIFECQRYMLKRMYDTSRTLFFTTLLQAVLDGIVPAIELLLGRNLIVKLTAADWRGSVIYIVGIVAVGILQYLAAKLLSLASGNSYVEIKRQMWFDLFEKTSTLDLALAELPENMTLYSEAKAATSNNRCTNVLNSFFGILSHLITLVSTLAVMVSAGPFVLLLAGIVAVVQTATTVKAQRQQYQTWKEDAEISKEISYCMGLLFNRKCANEMRLHNLSRWVLHKYQTVQKRDDELWKENHKRQAVFSAVNFGANMFQKGALYFLLAWQMIFRNLSFADFTMCFNSAGTITREIVALIEQVISVGEQAGYIKSFKAYMELENVIAVHSPDGMDISAEKILSKPICFRNVSFRYPGSAAEALRNVDVEIEPKQFYVIVGANGAGKTTFINLLMRLYDPAAGTVSLGDMDIRKFDFQKYRDCFGVVFQNYMVFDYSIIENITLEEHEEGAVDVKTQEKVDGALEKAGLKAKMESLEKGIYTRIGRAFDSQGVNLSGGEYQKIALAKALYRDTPVLVLDEPSSALDAFAEDDLITTFRNAGKSKTVFYISHRLSVARYAYKVIFINEGTVEGFDTHENLLEKCPLYRKMYHVQAKHYLEESG